MDSHGKKNLFMQKHGKAIVEIVEMRTKNFAIIYSQRNSTV